MKTIGVVTIGRNEGDRLRRCLQSLKAQIPQDAPIIYVDSGSTDGSVEMARALGVQTIALDLSIPFTAARARNQGFWYLLEHYPEIEYVQFIDGDCELYPSWLETAIATLDHNYQLAVVCGRRREKYPDASPYNRLADMEWDTPVGEAKACGGDALMRIKAIQEVNGYNPSLICGEEPEMCILLREKGWKIERIDADMTLHDAGMFKFSQWWKRSVRGGWAIAEGYAIHGAPPEKYMVKEHFSGWLWGLTIPLLALSTIWLTKGLSLFLLLGYLILMWRIYLYRSEHGDISAHAYLYAFWCVLSKFPQAWGQVKYWWTRWRGKQATLIEYKKPMVKKT